MPRKDEEIGKTPPGFERPSLLAHLVRINRYLIALLILPLSLFSFWPPFRQERAQHEIVRQLAERRDQLKKEADYVKLKLDLIKNDPAYLEVTARDSLSMQKDGETVVEFDDE